MSLVKWLTLLCMLGLAAPALARADNEMQKRRAQAMKYVPEPKLEDMPCRGMLIKLQSGQEISCQTEAAAEAEAEDGEEEK